MDYFTKIEAPSEDLAWNIPEKKQNTVNIIGGNASSFRTEIKIAEYLTEKYPIKDISLVLPDALKNKLPPLSNFKFLSSTDSGSFSDAKELKSTIDSADYNLLLGDLSKNTITVEAVSSACQSSVKKPTKPILATRDAIDLFNEAQPEKVLTNENLIIFASMAQLQKLLRAAYYPKMLLLSQSLIQVAETLHKFTLSYPVSIITLHSEQILIVKNGNVKAVPLAKTNYSPINLWQGELAAKILALNLFSPGNFEDATISALFS